MSRTATHDIWMGIRSRCGNPKDTAFRYYGARGIRVCPRWQTFENFLEDMGERPDGLSLDRINNDGPYSPENCRWATQKEQLRNTRRNHIINYDGKDWCVTDLATHLGLKPETLFARLRYDWPQERWAEPPRHCGPAYSRKAASR